MGVYTGSWRPDQMGSAGAALALGLWSGRWGMPGLPLRPPNLLALMEKVTCTTVFGNERVNACGQRGR